MKLHEVPQDPKDFKEGDKLKKLVYAVDKEGHYTGTKSAGWEAENFATKQAWDAVDEELAAVEEEVKSGKLSPVAYFMHKNLMDLSLLAKYVGKWKWQVKNHMKPKVFKKLKPAMLEKYAEVFNVKLEEFVGFGQ